MEDVSKGRHQQLEKERLAELSREHKIEDLYERLDQLQAAIDKTLEA